VGQDDFHIEAIIEEKTRLQDPVLKSPVDIYSVWV